VGKTNTSFVEWVNMVTSSLHPELLGHLNWWQAYDHFARYHEFLAVPITTPIQRKEKQQPVRYRRGTPTLAAGLTYKRWTVKTCY
jgi:hypothetical protein